MVRKSKDASSDNMITQLVTTCFSCKICTKNILQPTSLACGHQFCHACIVRLANEAKLSRGSAKCPTCRAVFNIENTVTNTALSKLFESVDRVLSVATTRDKNLQVGGDTPEKQTKKTPGQTETKAAKVVKPMGVIKRRLSTGKSPRVASTPSSSSPALPRQVDSEKDKVTSWLKDATPRAIPTRDHPHLFNSPAITESPLISVSQVGKFRANKSPVYAKPVETKEPEESYEVKDPYEYIPSQPDSIVKQPPKRLSLGGRKSGGRGKKSIEPKVDTTQSPVKKSNDVEENSAEMLLFYSQSEEYMKKQEEKRLKEIEVPVPVTKKSRKSTDLKLAAPVPKVSDTLLTESVESKKAKRKSMSTEATKMTEMDEKIEQQIKEAEDFDLLIETAPTKSTRTKPSPGNLLTTRRKRRLSEEIKSVATSPEVTHTEPEPSPKVTETKKPENRKDLPSPGFSRMRKMIADFKSPAQKTMVPLDVSTNSIPSRLLQTSTEDKSSKKQADHMSTVIESSSPLVRETRRRSKMLKELEDSVAQDTESRENHEQEIFIQQTSQEEKSHNESINSTVSSLGPLDFEQVRALENVVADLEQGLLDMSSQDMTTLDVSAENNTNDMQTSVCSVENSVPMDTELFVPPTEDAKTSTPQKSKRKWSSPQKVLVVNFASPPLQTYSRRRSESMPPPQPKSTPTKVVSPKPSPEKNSTTSQTPEKSSQSKLVSPKPSTEKNSTTSQTPEKSQNQIEKLQPPKVQYKFMRVGTLGSPLVTFKKIGYLSPHLKNRILAGRVEKRWRTNCICSASSNIGSRVLLRDMEVQTCEDFTEPVVPVSVANISVQTSQAKLKTVAMQTSQQLGIDVAAQTSKQSVSNTSVQIQTSPKRSVARSIQTSQQLGVNVAAQTSKQSASESSVQTSPIRNVAKSMQMSPKVVASTSTQWSPQVETPMEVDVIEGTNVDVIEGTNPQDSVASEPLTTSTPQLDMVSPKPSTCLVAESQTISEVSRTKTPMSPGSRSYLSETQEDEEEITVIEKSQEPGLPMRSAKLPMLPPGGTTSQAAIDTVNSEDLIENSNKSFSIHSDDILQASISIPSRFTIPLAGDEISPSLLSVGKTSPATSPVSLHETDGAEDNDAFSRRSVSRTRKRERASVPIIDSESDLDTISPQKRLNRSGTKKKLSLAIKALENIKTEVGSSSSDGPSKNTVQEDLAFAKRYAKEHPFSPLLEPLSSPTTIIVDSSSNSEDNSKSSKLETKKAKEVLTGTEKPEKKKAESDSESKNFIETTPKRKPKIEKVLQAKTPPPSPSTAPQCINLCYSGLEPKEVVRLKKFQKHFPNVKLSNEFHSNVTTHLIVAHDNAMCADCTLKFLLAVSCGCWVISEQWIQRCLQTDRILPVEPYEMLDTNGCPGPKMSRLSPRRLFSDFEVLFGDTPEAYTYVEKHNCEDIIGCSGGLLIDEDQLAQPPTRNYRIVILPAADVPKELKNCQYTMLIINWLVESVEKFKLEPAANHLIRTIDNLLIMQQNFPPEMLEPAEDDSTPHTTNSTNNQW